MTIGKIKPEATIVAQFAAGVEVEAIQQDGKIYLPVMNLGTFKGETTSDAPAPAPSKKSAPKEEAEVDGKEYTEKELTEMDSKELKKILKDEFEIDSSDYPGKDTNKKLRDLILKAQEGGGKSAPKEEASEEGGEAEELSELANSIADLLESFDNGDLNKKKLITKIMGLASEDADEKKVTKLVEKFESDDECEIDSIAVELEKVIASESPKEDKKSGSRRAAKSSSKKDEGTLVEKEDLSVDDRVNVYWEEEDLWAKGTVKSIKKGKVNIAYDDDTEAVLDENNTKIKLLED